MKEKQTLHQKSSEPNPIVATFHQVEEHRKTLRARSEKEKRKRRQKLKVGRDPTD